MHVAAEPFIKDAGSAIGVVYIDVAVGFICWSVVVICVEADVDVEVLRVVGFPAESFPFHAESIPADFRDIVGEIPEVFIDFEVVGP